MSADPLTMMVIQVGLTAASYALTASQTIKGPRLDDLNVTLGDFGTPIPRIFGTRWAHTQTIHAEKLKEKKKTSKGKGPKMTEYSYFGTWLSLITDHPLDAITKIKMDNRLVYQRTGAGPVSLATLIGRFVNSDDSVLKLREGRSMRLYLGDQTEPDPRYEAWCEDKHGPNTAPAFIDNSYISFRDIPLEKFGNRLPQVEVEAVRNAVASYPSEQLTTIFGTGDAYLSPDRTRLVFTSPLAGFEVWDVPTRTRLISGGVNLGAVAVRDDGSFYGRDGPGDLWLVGEGGGTATVVRAADIPALVGGNVYLAGGTVFLDVAPSSGLAAYVSGLVVETVGVGFNAIYYFEDVDGNAWAIGGNDGTKFGLAAVPTLTTTHLVETGEGGVAYAMDNGTGRFLVLQGNKLYLINKTNGAIEAGPVAVSAVTTDGAVLFRGVDPGDSTIWIGFTEYSTTDLSVVQTVAWPAAASANNPLYDAVNHAIWTRGTLDPAVTVHFLNRVGGDGVTLGSIISEVAGWCGLSSLDVGLVSTADFSVKGWSVTQGTGRAMLDPLLSIHDVDARPHDFTIQFLPRGGAPGGTIETVEFVRSDRGGRYSTPRQQPHELPQSVTIVFADTTRDQQRNTVTADQAPEAANSQREDTIDLNTFADTPDGAQQKVDRYLRRQWNSRERVNATITAQQLAIEPGDVRTLSLDGLLLNARLDRMTVRGLSVECEFVRDEMVVAAVNGNTVGPPMAGRDPEVIYVPTASKGFVIDGPLVADAHNDINPILYAAAGAYGPTWPGAAMFRGDDGSYDETFAAFEAVAGAVWGYATGALADANPNLWDRGSSLQLTIFGGSLTSQTEAALNANPSLNLAAVGANGRWEYLQFATATLTASTSVSKTYTLSGFKRGRRGTEAHVGSHAAGDALLMLSAARPVELGAGDVGDALSFKVATIGRDPEGSAAIDLTFTGSSLKPLAPCQVRAVRDSGTGDWAFSWVRRTRIGGAWIGGTTIPLGENSESYELVVPTSGGSRTISASSPTAVWTAAQQTSDYGAPQAGLPAGIAVYQLSDAVGRGFASQAPLAA